MNDPREPTAAECSAMSEIEPGRFAIWYPSMGGYVGRAVIERSDCFEVWVWHNGEFAFDGDGRRPTHLHHCDPEDFIDFGRNVMRLLSLD